MVYDNPNIGFVGGTGFDNIDGFSMTGMRSIHTPFNGLVNPRSLTVNELADLFKSSIKAEKYEQKHAPDVLVQEGDTATSIFLARHGAGHRNSACDTNYLANMYALFVGGKVYDDWTVQKSTADYGVGFTAVGSLTEEIPVGSLIVFDGIYRHDHESAFGLNPFLGPDVIHLGTHGEECNPVIRQLLKREMEYLDGEFAELDVPDGERRPVVHHGGTLALINRDDTFSTPAESATLRAANGNNVAVGMTGYELISAMLCGGMMGLVGLVVDMDNTTGRKVDQDYINANVGKFKPIVAGLTQRIIERGEYIDPGIGLLPLQRSILSPATPKPELKAKDPKLVELIERVKALDEDSLKYPDWYDKDAA